MMGLQKKVKNHLIIENWDHLNVAGMSLTITKTQELSGSGRKIIRVTKEKNVYQQSSDACEAQKAIREKLV